MDHFGQFLGRHGHDVTVLAHPLDNYAGRRTQLTQEGTVLRSVRRWQLGLLNLLLDLVLSCAAVPRRGVDVVVAANNFDALSALVAKHVLRKQVPRICYFAADYSEDRFGAGSRLSRIYDRVERIVLRHATLVVSNTRRAAAQRRRLGLDETRSIVVPNGVRLPDPQFTPKHIDKSAFVYVGSVTREHGLYELLEVMAPLIRRLVILGVGDDLDRVVGLCQSRRIEHEVLGRRGHDDVLDYLRDFGGIGLAPYNLTSRWTYYCSPLKVNEYVACGVPVFMSAVPEVADLVISDRLGAVFGDLDLAELRGRLDALDTVDFHRRAERFYHQYGEETLYARIPLTGELPSPPPE